MSTASQEKTQVAAPAGAAAAAATQATGPQPVKANLALVVVAAVAFGGLCFFVGEKGRLVIVKLLVLGVMLVAGIIALVLVRRSRLLTQELQFAQTEMEMARDQVVLAATLARAQMSNLKDRLTKEPEDERAETIAMIVKALPPVVSMLMAKEKNLFKWGLGGLKLAQSIYKYFKK